MTNLTIENKKYVLLPEEEFKELRKNALANWKPERTFSIAEAREYSKKRIKDWATSGK